MKYKKTVADLEKVAVKWWPKELEQKVAEFSVVPKLIETQEKFVSTLNLAGDYPEQIFQLIEAGSLSPNLFLKHLVILADFGGELIKRLGREFDTIFPSNKDQFRTLCFKINGEEHQYTFRALPVSGLSNNKLKIDGNSILSA